MPSSIRICVVAFFPHDAFYIPLTNLRKIVQAIDPRSRSIITLPPALAGRIPFDETRDRVIVYPLQTSPLLSIVNYTLLNLRISWHIFWHSQDTDRYLFFIETGLLLPMIAAKIRNKRVVWLLPSSLKKMIEHGNDLSSRMMLPVQEVSYRVADTLVVYSPNLVREWDLLAYRDKIRIAHEHLIDTTVFTAEKPLRERPFAIGFVGRLSAEKGVRNFVEALPRILREKTDIQVCIGGDGPLRGEIEEFLRREKISDRVYLAGWVAHASLPEFLNGVQLLVLPSFTEGLPNIMLEAVACGTLVAVTPVGAMPDIIRDGETGFILKENSPACIAETAVRVLGDPTRETIARDARARVAEEFTLGNTVREWKEILTR